MVDGVGAWGQQQLMREAPDLRVSSGGDFVDFSGLESLTSIGGDLYVSGSVYSEGTGFESFSGLESLTTIGADLLIDGWDFLTDVTALHGVTSVGADFTVTDNDTLLTADAETLRDAIGLGNIGGSVTISGNQ